MTQAEMAKHLNRDFHQTGYAIQKYVRKQKIKKKEFNSNKTFVPKSPVHSDNASNDCFVLDFTEHKELYERLLTIAQENFRTPQNQALFMIHEYCQRYKNSH